MSPKVFFEGEVSERPVQAFQYQVSGITRLVVKYSGGHIKTKEQAGLVLFLVAMVALSLSILLFFSVKNKVVKSPTPYLINRPQPAEGYIPK